VHYQPGQPLNVRGWRDSLPGAAMFVNANFFDENDHALGLLVADGTTYGAAYNGYGGMFQVQNGQPRVRSNTLEPYIGEALEQAVQGFPVLVANGVQSYDNTRGDTFARRTIVAQDRTGRILLMVTPLVGMTLVELSEYLPSTDLELVNAVNLDGGGSTMLYLNAPGQTEYILSSFDPVPAVLAVYPRQ
jgi:exopolysaccharide biosynthesis protein